MTPFFSIIIPVYNVAPYLRECLDSVLAQTFTDWEALCVDDGSTDASGTILDEYAAIDTRFKIFHQPNAGVSAARNAALDVAKGEWIGFVDADDRISSQWFATCFKNVGSFPGVDVVKMTEQKWRGRECPDCCDGWQVESFLNPKTVVEYVSSCVTGFCMVRYFFKRKAVGRHRFLIGIRINEDVIFVSRILFACTSLLVCSYNGYFYRMREGSAIHSGIGDNDIANFIRGISSSVQGASDLSPQAKVAYKRWAGCRIISDVTGCLVSAGKNPKESVLLARKFLEADVIRLDRLGIKRRCCALLLLYFGNLGFFMMWFSCKVVSCCRKIGL